MPGFNYSARRRANNNKLIPRQRGGFLGSLIGPLLSGVLGMGMTNISGTPEASTMGKPIGRSGQGQAEYRRIKQGDNFRIERR